MRTALNTPEPIFTKDLARAAQTVIEHVRRETSYPFLLDAKTRQSRFSFENRQGTGVSAQHAAQHDQLPMDAHRGRHRPR